MIGNIVIDKSEVGYYEQAQKIIKIILTIITSLGTVMMPRIANIFADGEKENKVFKKAKLEMYEITKEEYELANGINVFEDATYRGKENHRYLSIKIYVYSEETQNYELVTLSEIKFAEGTPHRY